MVYEIVEGNGIYYPMTPSKWIEDSFKRESCMVITMTSGGVNGNTWYEFIKPIDIHEGLNNVTDVMSGNDFFINASYIVKIKWYDFIRVKYHTTNQNYGEGTKELYFIVSEDKKIYLRDMYKSEKDYLKEVE